MKYKFTVGGQVTDLGPSQGDTKSHDRRRRRRRLRKAGKKRADLQGHRTRTAEDEGDEGGEGGDVDDKTASAFLSVPLS